WALMIVIKPILMDSIGDHEHFFPDDIATDRTERFMCAEIIREKILWTMQDEIPHGTAVEIESFSSRMRGDTEIIDIGAVIVCEKDSHKGMIIGKGGERLKQIGTMARKDMEELLGAKVGLKIFVKVKEDWRNRERFIMDMGFADE
ncbi:MAG: KH domain-containing protein, partial [Oscillospiraceae bacterium]